MIPPDLLSELKKNKNALDFFNKFTSSSRKEYISWIIGAKTGEPRNKRIAITVEWTTEGKDRNWKYK